MRPLITLPNVSEALSRNTHDDVRGEDAYNPDPNTTDALHNALDPDRHDAYVLAEEVRRLRHLVVELGARYDVENTAAQVVRLGMLARMQNAYLSRPWKEFFGRWAHALEHDDVDYVATALAEVRTLTPTHDDMCHAWARKLRGLV